MDNGEKFKLLHQAVYDAFRGQDHSTYEVAMKSLLDFTILISPPQYGDAVHADHIYRGLSALQSGSVRTARIELLKAGMPPLGATVRTAGPNFLLARELLKIGEREPVLDYCRLVKRFWILPFRALYLNKWVREIRKGGIPDFKANLYYCLGSNPQQIIEDYPRFP